ncbi:MAG: hypothetical protein LUE11_04540 [Clostridia bacterium]|nr:hypothetical protein [Clostridia bacterium]
MESQKADWDKSSGTFMAVCEMSDSHCIWSKIVEDIKVYTPQQLKEFFVEAGFQNINIDQAKKVWVCVTGKKA